MASPHSSGFSLLEVLVALLVLSAGVIGAAALQLSAWQLTHQSHLHTIAQQLASEMLEWIQALDDASLARLENLDVHAAGASTLHCYGRHCSTESLVQFIAADWSTRADEALPGLRIRLCRDTSPWDGGTSAYRWTCRSDEGAMLVIKMGWHDKTENRAADHPLLVMGAAR